MNGAGTKMLAHAKMLTRSWDLTSRAKDEQRAENYQLVRNSLSFYNHPYNWTPDFETDAVRAKLFENESRYRGVVRICARPDMINTCCDGELKLQRIPAIDALCRTRSTNREENA